MAIKPSRIAISLLPIRKQLGFSDREPVGEFNATYIKRYNQCLLIKPLNADKS